MANDYKKQPSFRYLIMAVSLVLLIAGLKLASAIFIPIILAFFIATVSFPITNFLRTHRVPRFLAVLITVLVDFAFLTGIVLIVFALAGDLQEKWETKYQILTQNRIEEVSDFLVTTAEGWNLKNAREGVNEYFTTMLKDQLDSDKIGKFFALGTGVVGKLASLLSNSFIIIVLTIFMLLEARMFGRRLNAICEAKGPNFQRMMTAAQDIQRYMGIKTIVSLGTGLLAGILCWLAGLDFFVLWGILAFVFNYIPVVGSIIAGIPPVILALLVYGGPNALAVGAGYAGINVFLGNLVEPMLLGRRFGISTLVVVLAVLLWGWIWGAVGMLLAVPLTMIIKVLLDNSKELRWLSIAISKEQSFPEEDTILQSPSKEPNRTSQKNLLSSQNSPMPEGGNR